MQQSSWLIKIGLGVCLFLGIALLPTQVAAADTPCPSCSNLKVKPEVDPIWGTVHAAGAYPDLHTTGNFLPYGAQKAYEAGFRTLEIWLSPNVCSENLMTPQKTPHGFYQTTKWCVSNKPDFINPNLTKLAQEPDYQQVLGMPFHTFILTVDTLNIRNALSQSKVQTLTREANTTEVDLLYQEIFEFASYLLKTYKDTDKTFIFSTSNELEFRITARTGCFPNCEGAEPDPISVANAITWINTIDKAVKDAKKLYPNNGVKLYTSAEVSHVITKEAGKKSGLTEVLPRINVDLIGWSAHEANGKIMNDQGFSDPAATIQEGLNKIAQYANDSPDFGNKNVFISEIAIPEMHATPGAMARFKQMLQAAKSWGVPSIVYWEIFDNECETFMPTANQCLGLWIIKPDGSYGEIYSTFFKGSGADLYNGAQLVELSIDGAPIPLTATTKQVDMDSSHQVKITYKNTGNRPWRRIDGYTLRLAQSDDVANQVAGSYAAALPAGTVVAPGGTYTYQFDLKLSELKSYALQWQPVQSQQEWFGDKTPVLTLVGVATLSNNQNQTGQDTKLCRADINEDHVVDVTDYSLLVRDSLQPKPSSPRSDIDRNGTVQSADFSLLLQYLFTKGEC